ncbi:hypothetical protein BH23ACT4_BH23ACT4_14790 [soil metagenome]
MTAETLADQISKVRERLTEIEEERADLAPEDFSRKADLIDEERTLEAQLAVLRDSAADEMGKAASVGNGDVSGPNGPGEGENGKASGYERVPDDDQELNDTDGDQR